MWKREFPSEHSECTPDPLKFWKKIIYLKTPALNPNVFDATLHLHAQWRFIRAWKHRRVPDLHLISMNVYCTLQLWFQGAIGINSCPTTLWDRPSAQGSWAPNEDKNGKLGKKNGIKNWEMWCYNQQFYFLAQKNKTCHKNTENVTIPYGIAVLSPSFFPTVFFTFCCFTFLFSPKPTEDFFTWPRAHNSSNLSPYQICCKRNLA